MVPDSALDPTRSGGPRIGSVMVTRETVLGVVCLCPEGLLSREPPTDATQVIDCFQHSGFRSVDQLSLLGEWASALWPGLFFFLVFCVNVLWSGRTSYLVESMGGGGSGKEAICAVLILSYTGSPNLGKRSLQVWPRVQDCRLRAIKCLLDIIAFCVCIFLRTLQGEETV